MNHIRRIAAGTVLGTALLVPATIGQALAEPYPWHDSGDSQPAGQPKTKAQIEYEERLQMATGSGLGDANPDAEPAATEADTAGFPWNTVGLAALGAGVLAAGGVALARRARREPHPA
jgi:hypothetical protein